MYLKVQTNSLIDILRPLTGVTLIVHFSTDRLDRLHFHLARWKGPMSLIIQLREEELSQVIDIIMTSRRKNIRWSFLIIPTSDQCFYVNRSGEKKYHNSCYDINIMRNIAIESIQTTHFLMLDGDAIVTCIIYSYINNVSSVFRTKLQRFQRSHEG